MIDGIIFDVDGVLVDVTESYWSAIKATVNYITGERVGNGIIKEMKQIEGFNNDWDLTYAAIKGKKKALESKERRSKEYACVKDTFQELYLGSRLFERTYKKPASIGNLRGFIKNEKLLIKENTLDRLANFKLGIATGRPRLEALIALRKLIPKYFKKSSLVALEDCEFEKPDPAPLLLVKDMIGCTSPIYVGDTYNDILAARRAKMPCIYVGSEGFGDFKVRDVNGIADLEVLV